MKEKFIEAINRQKDENYWRLRAIRADEKDLVIPVAPITQYKPNKTKSFNWTPASIVGFAGNCLKYIAP